MQKSRLVTALAVIALASAAAAQSPEPESLEPSLSAEALAELTSSTGEAESGVAAGNAERARPSAAAEAVDEIELSVTEITGNQELPKMLYIVPWQKSDTGDLVDRPVTSALDNALDPIERTEFIRQVDYYGDLYAGEEE